MICGTGTYSTAETLELTQAAEDAGADGIVVVTPYYNKPPQRGLVAHFEHIADATELPIIVYNIPSRTGTRIEHETMLQIAEKPNVVAVKDSTGDFKAIEPDLGSSRRLRGLLRRRLGDVRLRVPGRRRGRERGFASRRTADQADDRPDRDRRRAGRPQAARTSRRCSTHCSLRPTRSP